MAIRPQDFLDTATVLSDSNNESDFRTSIGRSYYCSYHKALSYLEIEDTEDWVGGRGGVHQKVIDSLSDSGTLKIKGVSYILQAMKEKRTDADYDLSVEITQDDAKAALMSAKRIIEILG